MIADIVLLTAAHILGYLVCFDASLTANHWENIKAVLPWFIPAQLVIFYYFGLYLGMWRYFSMPDMLDVLKASLVSSALVITTLLFFSRFEGFARTVFFMDGVFTFLFICGHRFLIRLYHQKFFLHMLSKPKEHPVPKKLLILGAGDAGEQVTREVLENPGLPYKIKGFLDDDQTKIGRRIHGIPVLNSIDNLFRQVQIAAGLNTRIEVFLRPSRGAIYL